MNHGYKRRLAAVLCGVSVALGASAAQQGAGSSVPEADRFIVTTLGMGAANGRTPDPFVIYGSGPTEAGRIGTAATMQRLKKAYAADIDMRTHLPRAGLRIQAHNISPGVIYKKAGVTVTAFAVDHGTANPAYGYRVNYAGRSVVLSRDSLVQRHMSLSETRISKHR